MSEARPNLVFFGIEISDYERDSNMLQIFMKCGTSTFNSYVNPIKPIPAEVTKVNHLTVRFMQLYRDNVPKPSRPLPEVMKSLLQYLKQFDGPCILVGHKHTFCDAVRLIHAIKWLSKEKEFAAVIDGFTSTFQMFLKKFPEKKEKDLVLHKLAKEAGFSSTHRFKNGRNVKHNTILLEKLALHSFSVEELKKARRTFLQRLRNFERWPQRSLTVHTEFTDMVTTPFEPRRREADSRTKLEKKSKRASRIKENAEEKASGKTKKIPHDFKESRKMSKAVVFDPAMRDYDVSLRTRTRIAMSDDIITGYRSQPQAEEEEEEDEEDEMRFWERRCWSEEEF